MTDLDVIKTVEKHINEPIKQCELDEIMNASARCSYVIDARQQVIGLNLQNCQLSDISWLKKLKHLSKLNLSLNPIEKVFALKELIFLNCLNLQKTALTDITALRMLTHLQWLNLQDNQISELKPLRELNKLHQLNLQANQISQLKYLSELTHLTVLNLNSNQISELSALNNLKKLTTLYLNSNHINQFHALENLTGLIELDLRFNQLKRIEPLAPLQNLTVLYLSSNEISELEPLKQLTTLTRLYLSTNKIIHVEALSHLYNLTELDLRFNFIADMSPLKELSKLTELSLERNQIQDITVVKYLNQLTLLNLRNNQINCIDAVQHLSQLKQLYLSQNQIENLPDWIIDLNLKIKWSSGGDGISISNNPITIPPPEIIYQGTLAIKKYFKVQAQQQHSDLDEVRVFLLGDSGVGKTALIKLLRDKPLNKNEIKTQFITISHWQCENTKVHFWDCGGDLSLQTLHQLFLTNNGVYIVVLNNEDPNRIDFWLKKIAYFAPNAPVLVTINKTDLQDNSVLDFKPVIKQSLGLIDTRFFTLSCSQNLGITEFKAALITAFKTLPMMKSVFLESWMQIKNAITLQQKSQPFISLADYQQLCQQHGVEELENQQQLAQLLHEIGVSLYFKNNSLKEAYLIEPHWFIYGLYSTLTAKELVENKGQLPFKNLPKLLKENNPLRYNYATQDYNYLIKLILSQQIGYLADKNTLVIPQLLSLQEPDFEFSEMNALRFRFYYYYLDETTLSRFIIQLHDDIELCWRTGVILKNPDLDCRALVKIDFVENLITIIITGDKKRDYFFILQKTLQEMNHS